MSFNPESPELVVLPKIEIRIGFDEFVPVDFRENPLDYFEREGVNIKSGVVEHDEAGLVKEDPTAVKVFPPWQNNLGEELKVVAKKVNTVKSQVGKTGDPFYEYKIMELAQEFELPAPKPIAKVEQSGEYLIVMQKIDGITWTENGMKPINESNLSNTEKQDLLNQAEKMMGGLQKRFEEIGLIRTWKLKDMIFDVDLIAKTIKSIVPTDWERTKIDEEKLAVARSKI